METILLLMAFVIMLCVWLNNASNRIGMPVLLAFILLGMLFGNTGWINVEPEDFPIAEQISTFALIFIIFYGGFGTNWQTAKKIVAPAGALASLGVVLTAALLGVFMHFCFGWGWYESFLVGAVLSPTDAASVFSILRSKKLGLKNNTAPILELESGSNDPFAYMLTIIVLTLMKGNVTAGSVVWLLFAQLAFGVGCGFLIAKIAIKALKKTKFATSGFDSLFMLSVALFSYSIPSLIGGNGYLSAYIAGIMIGNADFPGKKSQVNFFDGITGLMQVVIFFVLGLLANIESMHRVLLPAIAIFFFLLIIGRFIAVSGILVFFKNFSLRQMGFISFVGLRGASSIVFAIVATTDEAVFDHDILNIVFCVVLLSISIQGFLLPMMAKWMKMIDDNNDVMTTFNDFSEGNSLQFSQVKIIEDSSWAGAKVKDLQLPRTVLLCQLIHPDGTIEVPGGESLLKVGDTVILCSHSVQTDNAIRLEERPVHADSRYCGLPIREYSPVAGGQVIMIKRKGKEIIPNGETILMDGDVLYVNIG